MKAGTVLRRAALTGALVWTACAVALDRYGEGAPVDGSWDAIVVAGCKVRPDGTPSLALQRRTDAAIALWQQGKAPYILLTGGTTDSRPAESAVARRYGVEDRGVPAEVFLVEGRSTSTEENARFAAEMHPDIKRVLLVTDSYHVFRGERVFQRYFQEVKGAGSTPGWKVRLPGPYREVLAIGYYWAADRL